MYTYRSLFLSFIMCLKGIRCYSSLLLGQSILKIFYKFFLAIVFLAFYSSFSYSASSAKCYRCAELIAYLNSTDHYVGCHGGGGTDPSGPPGTYTCYGSIAEAIENGRNPNGSFSLGNHGVSTNNTCHPINIPTGNKYFFIEDFADSNISPLRWSLHFNSHQRPRLWSTPYDHQLVIADNLIGVKRGDGKIINFTVTNNAFFAPSQRIEALSFDDNMYVLRLADNTIETYNVSGQLQSIQYPSGITHHVKYSSSGNTITVSRLNESLVLDLLDGNVVKAMLPDNSEINYTWDISGDINNLIQVEYADNTTRTYLYENTSFPHYVTGIIDENGNRISSVEYDAQGRAISSEVGEPNSGIERTEIDYHDDGSRTLTNALGKQTTYHFTEFNGEYKMTQVEGHPSANCASANQAYTYDANGFMASKTDWKGNVTTYINNDRGLEVSRTEASGTSEARTTLTEWHPNFNLRTKITEPERETVFTYDIEGRLTSQEVSPR